MSDQEIKIALVGGKTLLPALRAAGMRPKAFRSLQQLTRPADADQDGVRAIVLPISQLRADSRAANAIVAAVQKAWPLVDVLLWADANINAGVVREALRAGATDVVLSKVPARCAETIQETIDAQQLLPKAMAVGYASNQPASFFGMVSRSRRMWDIFSTIERVAATDATVLILGETGVGKELIARALHESSQRSGPFVALNCGAIAETLIDSELFGHTKGAFTGANTSKAGLFRHAEDGTLMLDEISSIPESVQHRLLRALQENAIRPVGSSEEVAVNARVVAATTMGLEAEVAAGDFREDLFYRLDVIRLEIPPLRERQEDIVFLFSHFLKSYCGQYEIARPELSSSFIDALTEYHWPGNVRQLENMTERLVLTHGNKRLKASHFKRLLPFKGQKKAETPQLEQTAQISEEVPVVSDFESQAVEGTLAAFLEPALEKIESDYLRRCLARHRGRIGDTAQQAGIDRRTLRRKLTKYGIDKAEFKI